MHNNRVSDNNSDNVKKSLADKTATLDKELNVSSAEVIVPPDGGWAWIVMIASFLCCTVIDGIVFSSGLIQDSISKDFEVSQGHVALVSSLLSGFYLMTGPLVSAMANRYGFRPIAMSGGVFAAAAFGISYYASSIEFLLISYGVLGGIGFCMTYIPSVIILGFYFEKWRSLATGIAMCGSGVGTFIFAPLTDYLVKVYGWRTCLVIQAVFILSCVVYASAFRPIEPVKVARTDDCINNIEIDIIHSKPNLHAPTFFKQLPEGRFAYSVPNSAHNTFMGISPKHRYPTAAEVFKGINLERKPSFTNNKVTEMKNLRKPHPLTTNGDLHPIYGLGKELTTVGENDEETENQTLLLSTEIKPSQTRRHTVSGRRPIDFSKNNRSANKSCEFHTSSRPMYRDDIFFTGSLVRIPQYTSQTSLGYHMSVTRPPTTEELLEIKQNGCQICSEAVKRTLWTMLDTSLLKSPSFMLLAFSGFLTMMGFFVPFIFVVRRATSAGMDEKSALLIVSAVGVTNTIARILCGFLSSFDSISPLLLNNIAITAGGIATILSGIWITNIAQFIFATIFGVCIACFSALRSIIAVELMGLEKLTNAFGFLMLFQGLAAAIGAPIAGLLYDLTEDYDISFYFAGGLILLSGLICYPLNYVNKWEKSRISTESGE